MSDPTNWNATDLEEGFATFKDNAMAKEAAKRWNAYPGLIHALWECRNASDSTEIHVMIDDILGRLGELKA